MAHKSYIMKRQDLISNACHDQIWAKKGVLLCNALCKTYFCVDGGDPVSLGEGLEKVEVELGLELDQKSSSEGSDTMYCKRLSVSIGFKK